jgi:hypothetical protein
LPFRQQLILSEDLNQTDLGGLLRLAASILRIVLVVEVIGAAFLAVRFIPELGWSAGLWSALFHSISAFNNAGFGLHADSLSRWVADPVVNVVVPLLFILGGLGFTVILDVYAKRNWKRLELHSKLMLSGTMILIVWSFVAFLMLEWNNPKTLATLPHATERVWASWFQAVTTRTAGAAHHLAHADRWWHYINRRWSEGDDFHGADPGHSCIPQTQGSNHDLLSKYSHRSDPQGPGTGYALHHDFAHRNLCGFGQQRTAFSQRPV